MDQKIDRVDSAVGVTRRRFLQGAAGFAAVGGLSALAAQLGCSPGAPAAATSPGSAVQPGQAAIPPTERGGWPMYQGDPLHLGRTVYAGPRRPALVRSFDPFVERLLPPRPGNTGQNIQSSPVGGPDGAIYVSTFQSTVLALRDPGSGPELQLAWLFQPDGQTARHGTPALAPDGTVYLAFGAADLSGTLYAMAPPTSGTTAQVKWKAEVGPTFQSDSPTIGSDGTIYTVNATYGVSPGIVSEKGILRAFAPEGTLKWTAEVGPTLKAAPAIAPDGTVYIAGMNGLLYAVTPAAAGQQVASVKWAFDFGSHLGPTPLVTSDVPVSGGDAIGSGASATIGPDGTIYMGANNSNFYAIRPDGEMKWMVETKREIGGIWSTAALSPDSSTLFFGNNAGEIYALNAADGSVRWRHDVFGSVYTSPLLDSAGTLYVGGTVGHMFALDSATGQIVFDYDAGGPIWSAPLIRPDGTLVVIARTGRIQLLGER